MKQKSKILFFFFLVFQLNAIAKPNEAIVAKPIVSEINTPTISYDQLIENGNIALAAKDYKGAIEAFSNAILADQSKSKAYRLRGTVFYLTKENDKADTDLDKAIALKDSLLQDCYFIKGRIFDSKKDVDNSCKMYDKALEIYPDFKGDYNMNLAYFFKGDKDKAKDRQIELANSSKAAVDYYMAAMFSLYSGDFSNAKKYNDLCSDAFAIPNSNQYKESIAYQEYIPTTETALFYYELTAQIGDYWLVQKQFSVASNWYNRAVKAKPDNGEYYYKYATARANHWISLSQRDAKDAATFKDEYKNQVCPAKDKAKELGYKEDYSVLENFCK